MSQKSNFKKTEIGMIPEEWEVKKIRELTEKIQYGYTESASDKKIGPKFLRGTDIRTGKIDWSSVPYCKIDKKKFQKYKLEIGDIVITRMGTPGDNALIKDKVDAVFASYLIRLKLKKDIINPGFMYYLLQSNKYKYYVSTLISTSATPGLNAKGLTSFYCTIPSIPEQSAIAKILSDLDSKIELNQQMNKTLEAIGQAIFNHWFIDFEFPNENGEPYRSSGGEMVFNEELGKEIPKGWTVGKLGEFGTFKNGINYLRNESGDKEFFIANVRDIANKKLLLKEHLDKIELNLEKAKDYLLHDKDILIARSASPGEVSLVLGDLENVIYSGFSIRYRLNNPENFLYFFLILQRLKENLSNFAVGTTLQSVNQETLRNMKLVLPPNEFLNKFNEIIGQILGKTYNNLIQNQTLSAIRDSLLPKLMSGKIRVPMEARI